MPKNVKNTTFPNLFSLLAPHTCRGCGRLGDPLCTRCKNYLITHHQNICPICHQPNPTGKCANCQKLPPIYIAGPKSSLLGNLIQALKYESVRALAQPLAEIMSSILPKPSSKTTNYILVPLPTINRHIRERGLDHTLLIAKELARIHPQSSVQKLLLRHQNTVQVGSSRTTRLTQATNAYKTNPTLKINTNATYILLDDVWTTGASLKAAYSLFDDLNIKKILLTTLVYSGNEEIFNSIPQNDRAPMLIDY